MPRTLRLPAAVLLAALALAGCTTPTPMPTPPPTPDAAPVFASEEEALAAAEEAYGRYLAVVDAILADGGANPERLLDVASRDRFEAEIAGFAQMQADGVRGVGSATYDITLQSYMPDGSEVVIYSCDDISRTDLVDSNGESVVAAGRTEKIPYEVRLVGDPLIIAAREIWTGSGVCR